MPDPYEQALGMEVQSNGAVPCITCQVCEDWAVPVVHPDNEPVEEDTVKLASLLHMHLRHPLEAFKHSQMDAEFVVGLIKEYIAVRFNDPDHVFEMLVKYATTFNGDGWEVVDEEG